MNTMQEIAEAIRDRLEIKWSDLRWVPEFQMRCESDYWQKTCYESGELEWVDITELEAERFLTGWLMDELESHDEYIVWSYFPPSMTKEGMGGRWFLEYGIRDDGEGCKYYSDAPDKLSCLWQVYKQIQEK